MRKRLIILAQNVDENDNHRGFFIDWLKEFAGKFDEVSVITLAKGSYTLPSNVRVYSLGKEQGASKFIQALHFYWHLARLLPKSNGIFAHASPIFVIASWPLTFIYRKKIILWYLHRSNTLKLRVALVLCDRLVTADGVSLTIKSPKILSVGHGIDVNRFTTQRDWSGLQSRPLRIVSVGRLSPIKDFGTLIQVAALLRDHHISVEVRIVGQAVMPADHSYEQKLLDLVTSLGLSDRVHFIGSVPYRDVPSHYAWADIAVGCTPHGGIDKTLLEAMAAGCVVVTSNDVMGRHLAPYAGRLLFKHGDTVGLANVLRALRDYEAISRAMLESVRAHHNLSTTIAGISALL